MHLDRRGRLTASPLSVRPGPDLGPESRSRLHTSSSPSSGWALLAHLLFSRASGAHESCLSESRPRAMGELRVRAQGTVRRGPRECSASHAHLWRVPCTEAAAALVAFRGLKTHIGNRPTSPPPWPLMGVHVVRVSGGLWPASHPPRTLLSTACSFTKGAPRGEERRGSTRRCLRSRCSRVKSAHVGEGNGPTNALNDAASGALHLPPCRLPENTAELPYPFFL